MKMWPLLPTLVRVTVKYFSVLLWWSWTHSLVMLSRWVGPAGQGVMWSFWQARA